MGQLNPYTTNNELRILNKHMKKKKKVAVVGGAGYIGSFTSHVLREAGYEVVVIDNLSRGHKEAVRDFRLVKLNILREKEKLADFFRKEKFDAVLHFAALLQVGKSMEKPGLYFRHNVTGSLNVIESAVKSGVKAFVFSSTSAVYGNPRKIPTPENHPLKPTSPYGESKAMVEKILDWYWRVFKFPSASIRYFNASGAALDGSIGEDYPNESHLIPLLIKAALKDDEVTIFGGDYNTPDGTCIRDYVHVLDLAGAHVNTLKYLEENPGNYTFNAGTGKGYTNLEVVKMVEEVSSKKVNYKIGPRRLGDATILVADASKAKQVLKWEPKYSDLRTIIRSSWKWHSTHPRGFS